LGNRNVPIAVWKYVRLDYNIPNDLAQVNTNQRGMALFQFDPNAWGQGLQGWRLLYEELQFSSSDPPAAASGVPPYRHCLPMRSKISTVAYVTEIKIQNRTDMGRSRWSSAADEQADKCRGRGVSERGSLALDVISNYLVTSHHKLA